ARFDAIARRALTDDRRRFRDPDWDGLTQHYLGAAAFYYAWAAVDQAGRDPRPRTPLAQLGGSLRFPKGYNSPHGADADRLLALAFEHIIPSETIVSGRPNLAWTMEQVLKPHRPAGYKVSQAAECLTCHAVDLTANRQPAPPPSAKKAGDFDARGGVTCEAC